MVSVEDYSTAIRFEPTFPNPYAYRAIARIKQDRWEEGRMDFLQLLKLSPQAIHPVGEGIFAALQALYIQYWDTPEKRALQQSFEETTGFDLPKIDALATLAGLLWEAGYPDVGMMVIEKQVGNGLSSIHRTWPTPARRVVEMLFERLPMAMRTVPQLIEIQRQIIRR